MNETERSAIILVALVLMALTGCSGRKVMRDCRSLGDGFYECRKP
jgi:hypothetical protein